MEKDLESEKLPNRHHLPHEIPAWVEQGSRHFITIKAKNCIAKPFGYPAVAQTLIDALVFYNVNKRWFLWTATVMPDHLHFIATFDLSYGIKKTIHQWKAYQTREHGVDFQTDFFEHRIRNQTEFIEKATYIRMNPVRKGLASTPETWPYYWICKQ